MQPCPPFLLARIPERASQRHGSGPGTDAARGPDSGCEAARARPAPASLKPTLENLANKWRAGLSRASTWGCAAVGGGALTWGSRA